MRFLQQLALSTSNIHLFLIIPKVWSIESWHRLLKNNLLVKLKIDIIYALYHDEKSCADMLICISNVIKEKYVI